MSKSDELDFQKIEMTTDHNEVVSFIASGTISESMVRIRPSEDVKVRVGELIAREKEDELSAQETVELNLYIQLEHLMRLAKARAK